MPHPYRTPWAALDRAQSRLHHNPWPLIACTAIVLACAVRLAQMADVRAAPVVVVHHVYVTHVVPVEGVFCMRWTCEDSGDCRDVPFEYPEVR